MIKLGNISFSIEDNKILDGISLDVHNGEIISLTGKNGCGKTALLKVIAGKISHIEGEITLDGIDYSKRQKDLSKQVEYFPEALLDTEFTVRNLLNFAILDKKGPFSSLSEEDTESVDNILKAFNLTGESKKRIYALSDSSVKKTYLAQAFLSRKNILVIDNPETTLDMKSVLDLSIALKKEVLNSKKTIVLSTSNLNFASLVSDRIIVLSGGKIVHDGNETSLDEQIIKKYFNIDSTITKNVYNGKIEISYTV